MVKIEAGRRVLRHHSARASVEMLPGGVVDVAYWGVVGQSTLEALHAQVMSATLGAGALVIQLDKAAVIDQTEPLATHHFKGNDAPGCLIVPDGLLDAWLARADELAARGLMRIVFSRQQAALAYSLAADLAAARR